MQGAQGCADFPIAIAAARDIPLEKFITHTFPLEQLQQALDTALDSKSGSIKGDPEAVTDLLQGEKLCHTKKFHYKSLEEVEQRAAELGVSLPFAVDTHCLAYPLQVRNITFPNRLGIAPMEVPTLTPEGATSAYTVRRYVNEAIGGSAVIWFEAISIVEEGRSSQTQLLLTRDTLDEIQKMTAAVKEAGIKANGYAPYLIMQANHGGRYSNPGNKPAPMIAYRHPILEQYRAADDSCIVGDDYLKGLEVKFGEATQLAKEAGFDAVDIKSCHGYLLAELASRLQPPRRVRRQL